MGRPFITPAWQPCCMAGTKNIFCTRKKNFFRRKKNLSFLPRNMAPVQKPLYVFINFMTNSVTSLRPICVGYKEVERVGTCKLLGVIISDDQC